jgi:DNA-binding transcriptional ArsR family regulator
MAKSKASPEFEVVDIAWEKLRSVHHKLRQEMIHFIRSEKQVNVTGIYTKFKLPQSVASQQLSILREHNFVKTEREGKHILYSVNEEALSEFLLVAKQL